MPVFIRPIVPTSNKKQYVIAPDGTLLDVGLIPISTDAKNAITVDDTGICVKAENLVSKMPDNLLSVGVDGGLFISSTVSPKISGDAYNYIRIGQDGGIFISGNDILSNGAVNLLTIDPTDHKIVLTKEAIIAALERASHDEGNLIVPGTDGGCYLSLENLLGKNNTILYGDDAGKLIADLSLRYNLGTGKLDVIGYDGSTVVSSVTVPTSTSSLRGAYLADGKPSASGEDVTGDYFVSIAMQYDGLYDSGAFLKFRTHKSVPSEVEFEYTVDEEHSGVWPSSIKASFVGDNKVAAVSQERATTIAFSDGSILSITWTGISGTRISGTATFIPAVGIESGSYIRMVYLLDNGDVADVYVDVTSLVDVYVQGNGITIADNTVSVKAKPNGGITVDSTGVSVDTDWFSQQLGSALSPGNGIDIDDNNVSVEAKPNGGITVDSTGVSVDTNWFSQQLGSTLTAGNGINIADNTVSVKPKTNGGLSVDPSGVSVSIGDGISISDAGAIIAKLQQDGGLAIKHGTGEIYVDFSLLPADMLREIVLSMVQEGGGLSVDENGQLYVDFASMPEELLRAIVLSMVQEGGGLAVDEKGQIYVDFSSMPTDKFEAMLKSIRVPIWLTASKNFYVDGVSGSDTLDEGRGESESKPFKTLQAAVNYVTDNYNVSRYTVYINCKDVTESEQVVLPEYSRTTGVIVVRKYTSLGDDVEYGAVIKTSPNGAYPALSCTGGTWYLYDIDASTDTANGDTTGSTTHGHHAAIAVDGLTAYVYANDCRFAFETSNDASYAGKHVTYCNYGTLALRNNVKIEGSKAEGVTKVAPHGITVGPNGNIRMDNSNAPESAVFMSGIFNYTLFADGGHFARNGVLKGLLNTEGITEASYKYFISNGGNAVTSSGGPDFFGTIGNTYIEESTYSWYK